MKNDPFKSDVAVVVPVYKSTLNKFEVVSLTQCHTILSPYDIFYITPPNLDLSEVSNNIGKYVVKEFHEDYFAGIDGYNKLMLAMEFYKSFANFKYILIHQLDAFVFKDELSDWCGLGYDYIGAPWIGVPPAVPERGIMADIKTMFGMGPRMVGNGGFSLRKTSKFISILRILNRRARAWQSHEDIFWAQTVPSHIPCFKIPDISTALNFSFELDPRACYEMNYNKLPFGCHAWEKYDIDFWRPIFKDYGYHI